MPTDTAGNSPRRGKRLPFPGGVPSEGRACGRVPECSGQVHDTGDALTLHRPRRHGLHAVPEVPGKQQVQCASLVSSRRFLQGRNHLLEDGPHPSSRSVGSCHVQCPDSWTSPLGAQGISPHTRHLRVSPQCVCPGKTGRSPETQDRIPARLRDEQASRELSQMFKLISAFEGMSGIEEGASPTSATHSGPGTLSGSQRHHPNRVLLHSWELPALPSSRRPGSDTESLQTCLQPGNGPTARCQGHCE